MKKAYTNTDFYFMYRRRYPFKALAEDIRFMLRKGLGKRLMLKFQYLCAELSQKIDCYKYFKNKRVLISSWPEEVPVKI